MTQCVPHLTSSNNQEKLLNVLHCWPGGCCTKVSQSYLGEKAWKRHLKCAGGHTRYPFWPRPGSPAELGCCKEQPHTEVSPQGLPCSPPGADTKVLWRAAGIHWQNQEVVTAGNPSCWMLCLTSSVFPVFPASSWCSCAVTGNLLVYSSFLSARECRAL